MAATDEDRRQAATIYTSISTYVATAALGVLAGAIALLTYFSQQYHNLEASYVAIAVAVAVLVASLVAGGYGVNKVAKEGATGSWGIQARNGAFNTQAICALVGTLLVVLSVVLALAVGEANSSESASTAAAAGSMITNALKAEASATLRLDSLVGRSTL